ncbi:WxL domain-containing protein [Enterococcus termitis]|uniref:WxL domain-containing protein n=1 Tax=Enterococcus termitis TaxID=332950 RepID=A0A1E5H016_9ENTE|nr:WxL domain-containing protein [Enterococcus termitis]OEG18192.1 hypothetical protein BCR25_17025 [Enterococcus termitis]OJG97230.1 hypothetical protein RV18_GL001095 [Enterococcus termitis]
MKFKTLSSVALLATMTAGALVGPAAFAETESKTLTGKGTIIYKEDDSTNEITDPEKPGETIDPGEEITVNPNGGPITIDAVSNLDFGEQTIGVSPTAQTYKAAALVTKDASANDITRGHFVQWTDKRAGNDHTYEIRANLTQQFKNGTNLLNGATIAYSNGMLNSDMPVANWPTATPKNLVLTEDGGSQQVFDNTASTGAIGLGTYTAEFGQSAADVTNVRNDVSTGLAGDSVVLTVPAGLSISTGTYQADVTWSIEYTPAPVAP